MRTQHTDGPRPTFWPLLWLTILMACLAGLLSLYAANDLFTSRGWISDINDTTPTDGLLTFQIRFSDGSGIVVLADDDTPFAKRFVGIKRQQVLVSISEAPVRLER